MSTQGPSAAGVALTARFTDEHARPPALALHGPVHYLSSQDAPLTRGIDVDQALEFGVDAVALAYAEAHKEQLFFSKHIDWASETEYRLLVLNQSPRLRLRRRPRSAHRCRPGQRLPSRGRTGPAQGTSALSGGDGAAAPVPQPPTALLSL